MTVIIPPVLQAAFLLPRCWRWFRDLTWVQFLLGHGWHSQTVILHRAGGASQTEARTSSSVSAFGPYDKLYDPPSPTIKLRLLEQGHVVRQNFPEVRISTAVVDPFDDEMAVREQRYVGSDRRGLEGRPVDDGREGLLPKRQSLG